MKRRELIKNAAAFSFAAAMPFSAFGGSGDGLAVSEKRTGSPESATTTNPLKPPAQGTIPVAFLISDGAVLIDFAGPWEVFQDVSIPGVMDGPFKLYTVAETNKPIVASAGMKIVPDYTFDNAPVPKVIVIPAQNKANDAAMEWIRKSTKTADLTMSVCTGALVLAQSGLLSGKAATTHHNAYKLMAVHYPDIKVQRGVRFVEDGNLATAGGLSSGIDLALRVVERYFGRQAAENTAFSMEYQGQGWKNAESNQAYAKVRTSTAAHRVCEVCEMDVDAAMAVRSVYKGKTYYFCMQEHKEEFDRAPEKFLSV